MFLGGSAISVIEIIDFILYNLFIKLAYRKNATSTKKSNSKTSSIESPDFEINPSFSTYKLYNAHIQ